MLKRERVLNKLRELGFSFKRQAPNVDIYKNGQDRIAVPRNAMIDPDWVRSVLGKRCPREEIERFIQTNCG